MKPNQEILKVLFTALQQLLGERFSTNPSNLEVHGRDESYHTPHLPDAVVMVHTTREVSEIVKLCS